MKSIYRANTFMLALLLDQIIVGLFLINPLSKIFSYNELLVVSQILFLVVPALGYIMFSKQKVRKLLRLNKISIRNIMIIISISILVQPIGSFLSAITALFFENPVNDMFVQMSTNPYLVQLFIIAVVPAICEEITMRGIVLSGYGGVSRKKAAIVTGVFFAILHMNPQQFIYTFALGILFAYLVMITNSIFSTMIAHFMFNGIQVTLVYVATKINSNILDQTQSLQITLKDQLLFLVPLGIVAMISTYIIVILMKKLDRKNNSLALNYEVSNQKDEENIINIPLIIIIAIYLMIMAIL